MANEFKVKNGLIVDAGGAQITGGITGSTDFNTIVNKPTLISSSAQFSGDNITGSNLRATSAIVSPNITWSNILGSNGGEIQITQGQFKFDKNIRIDWGGTAGVNAIRDVGLRRNTTGSLEIYDGITADGAIGNRRDLILRNITGSNAFFSGSVNVTGSLTASLQKGYTWVGDGNNISVLVATSSFTGGSTDLSQLNTFTASAAIQLTNLETTSASLNISVSNLNTYTASVSNSIQQLNTFTASNANVSLNAYTGSISDPKFISIGASTSSLNLFTSSAALRLTNLETTSASVNISITNLNSYSASVSNSILYVNTVTASLNTFTASAAIRLTNLETTSASVNISITNINTFTASNANTSLNTYTGSISDPKFVQIGASTASLNLFTSSAGLRLTNLESTSASVNGHIADINSKTGSYARTNNTNTFNGTQIISGALYITQDLVVLGSSSIQNISSSNLVIGTSYVTLNTFSPSSRYAGFNFIDSGSAGLSSSLYYDSVDDEIVFVHKGNGTNVTSSHVVMGPETYDNLGNETYMTVNRIPKVTNYEHIGNSNISDTGTEISLNSLTSVTGSFVATAGITGSIRATNGVVSGSTQISLAGTSDYTSLFGGIAASTSSLNTLTASLATTYESRASATKTIFSGSSQISIAATSDYTSLFGGIASATASLNVFSASENAKNNTLATLTGSIETKFAAFGASTSSLNSFTASIDSRFSALQASTASLNVYTQSNDTLNTTQNNRLTALEVATGSSFFVSQSVFLINSYTGSDAISQSVTNARLVSLGIASSSLEFFTASQNTKNLTLATYTGSNDTKWANLAVYTASVDTKFLAVQSTTNSLNLYTASIITALTASGVNLTTNGALLVTLDVTASAFRGAIRATNGVISSSAQVSSITATVTGTNSTELVRGNMADNDQFRILVGGTATNAGFVEIATADDGTEPIYVRQYTGVFSSLVRTATLLDDTGNTSFPQKVTANSFVGSISASNGVVSGSSQIVGSSITTNAITIAGTSTALGGTITAEQIRTAIGTVVTGSAQITLSSTTGYSTTINQNLLTTSDVTHNSITGIVRATNGVVSGSSQIVGSSITTNAITIAGTSTALGGTITAEQIRTAIGTVVTGSAQIVGSSITTNTITIAGTSTALGGTITLPTITGGSGIVSGSSQVIGILSSLNTYTGSNDTTNTTQNTRLSRIEESTSSLNTLTASLATTYEGRASATKTIVSGSSQITLSSTTGFGTYINQAVLTTSSPTFNAISCTSLTETSSERYKENVITLNSSLNKVLNLRGVSYNRKENGANEIGLIAEEVQKIIPEIVTYDDNNQPDSVSYGRLSALLIEGMKEQQKQIEQLKAEIELLKNK
jgi:hypothetical protein